MSNRKECGLRLTGIQTVSYTLLAMSSLTTDYPEGVPTPDEMIAAYEQASGRTLRNMPYYTLFSLYRLVVIVILGIRAFPDDFKATFQGHVDSLITKMMDQAQLMGVAR